MINKLPVQVLDAPLNLALVLRIRRMRKKRLNTMLFAPTFPLLLKLAARIRKNSLRKPLLPLQHSHCFSRRQLMIKLLRRHNEPAIVINADQKPVLLARHAEWPSEIYLPQLIRSLRPEKIPALEFAQIPVLVI